MREVGLWPWALSVPIALGYAWVDGWRPAIGNEAEAGIRVRVADVTRDLRGKDRTALIISNSRLGGLNALDTGWWRGCGRELDGASALFVGTLNFASLAPYAQPLRALRVDLVYLSLDVLFLWPSSGERRFGWPKKETDAHDLAVRATQFEGWDPDTPGFSQGVEFLHRLQQDGAQVWVVEPPMRDDLAAVFTPARRAAWERGYARLRDAGIPILDGAQPTDPADYIDAVHLDEAGQAELRGWFCDAVRPR